jgi:hypothetical protein
LRGALAGYARRDDNLVAAYERAIGEIDSSVVIEIDGHLGQLVLLGGRARDVGVDQCL